jgi:hypothetical protein
MDREGVSLTEKQKNRKTEKQKNRKTEKQKNRKTEKQKNRKTKTKRNRSFCFCHRPYLSCVKKIDSCSCCAAAICDDE